MKHIFRYAITAVALTWAAAAVQAEEVRLGFVSTERVLKEARMAKKELVDLGNNIKTSADKFEKEAPTLPETQRQSRQKQILEQDRDFQRKRREFQEDLNARKNEELQLVIQRANKVIKDIAIAEKYDFIFQDAVYVNPKHDVTDKVIKALNAPAAK